jgi:hypothetical protein
MIVSANQLWHALPAMASFRPTLFLHSTVNGMYARMQLSTLAIIYFIVCSQAVPVRPARDALVDAHERSLYTQQEDRGRSVLWKPH